MTDHYGFTMASLNEYGSVFANPCKGDKNMSTLMYRPFRSWANNSEWYMRFEGEEVKMVALGTAWVAAVTNLNLLRIFSDGGLQKHIISLNGPVVTATGFKDEVAVVNHVADCLSTNEQMLEFSVFNIAKGTRPFSGRIPLSPGSCLTWFGYSEEGQLSSYDSKGLLRVFTSQYGGSWLPIFSATKVKKADQNYWVVGLNSSKLFCVVCKDPEPFPQVLPKPVLTPMNLSFPLASSDLGEDALENEFIVNNMHLSEIQKRIEVTISKGLDTASLDDEAFDMEAAQDRCILRLIASCCNSDKLVRATELLKLLSLEKSVRGAIQLATALKLPNLAERFNGILEERLRTKVKEGSYIRPQSSGIEAGVSVGKTFTLAETRVAESAIPSSPKLSAPLFTKKAKLSTGINIVKAQEARDKHVEDNGETKIDLGGKSIEELKRAQTRNPTNLSSKSPNGTAETKMTSDAMQLPSKRTSSTPFLKSSSVEETKKVDEEARSQRPSNPFLKSVVK